MAFVLRSYSDLKVAEDGGTHSSRTMGADVMLVGLGFDVWLWDRLQAMM